MIYAKVAAVLAAAVALWWAAGTVIGWRIDARESKELAERTTAAQTATLHTLDVERAGRVAAEDENANLKASLDGATRDAHDLGSRLFDQAQAAARARAVSRATGAAGGADAASGKPGNAEGPGPIDTALTAHLEACARDAERLDGWRDFYDRLRVTYGRRDSQANH